MNGFLCWSRAEDSQSVKEKWRFSIGLLRPAMYLLEFCPCLIILGPLNDLVEIVVLEQLFYSLLLQIDGAIHSGFSDHWWCAGSSYAFACTEASFSILIQVKLAFCALSVH